MKSRVFRSRGAGILASVWFIGAFASFLLVSPVVCAQERAIEGQPIAAISIVDSSGKPVSQENLSMPLAVGQPFDYSNERDAIRVLYRTGDFADIQVHADDSAGGLHLLKSYQLTRFTSFLHPSADLAGAGYNAAQAKIAVGSGGMFGQGLFHGQLVAGNFVPSQQTDFIFTVAGEELGFVGTIVIVFLLGVVIIRALRIATRADDLFGLLVASGIAMWFTFQSFVNIGMTIGIMPITGIPLPFVSYGGSAVFADMIAIGLLQSIHRRRTVFELARARGTRGVG